MLYTVECSYTDDKTHQEWNDFYSLKKLPTLISVTGFITSQRFKALSTGCPTYLAIHTIQNENTITSQEYKEKGGGNFANWQPFINDWYRNLYQFKGFAPAVTENEILLLCHTPLCLDDIHLLSKAWEMHAVGLDQTPAYRTLYIFPRDKLELLQHIEKSFIYEPLTPQLQSSEKYSAKNGA